MVVEMVRSDINQSVLLKLQYLAGEPPFDFIHEMPDTSVVMSEVKRPYNQNEPKSSGEIAKALLADPTARDIIKAEKFVNNLKTEMVELEETARHADRLSDLLKHEKDISHILVISRPGTYYNATKDDAYKDIPALEGADRLNSDRAAILGMQIACARGNDPWSLEDVRRLGNIALLGVDDKESNDFLRSRSREIHNKLLESGLRFVYAGRPDEASAIRRMVSRSMYIPEEIVDILDASEIKDTFSQAKSFKRYCEKNSENVRGVLTVTDALQTPRFTGMAAKVGMLGSDKRLFVFPRATAKNGFKQYSQMELRGSVYYAFAGMQSFNRSSYTAI